VENAVKACILGQSFRTLQASIQQYLTTKPKVQFSRRHLAERELLPV